ncbi:restriction endonuclease subunit S [Shewanella sp. ULN5]|uniref:restriction endonuclease subunit S n=1 Tax=Shewanella sp. ULN5 TaxID=2994678 RepID=UPI00273D838B|nr:restriction endonuclease subunit S [Shewanella sp. ULN5]MDP5146538.1 restriction endonuclease subunit S [Shewanella sp. ULN5]
MSALEQVVSEGYKQTEVGVIPKNWESLNLGDLAEVRMCKRILAWQTSKSGPIPFFKIGTFGGKPDAFIPSDLYNDFKKKFSFPEKGDVLISAAGTLGKTVVYDGEDAYFQDSNIVWLEIDKTKILNEYLFHYYKVIKWASTEGSTISRLYNGIIKASPIALPPLKEQTAIANALSDVDALLSELENIIAKKQAIKTATMQQLLTGKTRLPQFAFHSDIHSTEDAVEGKRNNTTTTIVNADPSDDGSLASQERRGMDSRRKGTKTSELGEIPEDWDIKQLKSILSLKNGYAFKGGNFSDKGPIVLTPGNFKLNGGLYFEKRNTKRYKGNYPKGFEFENGDLVIVMTDLTPDCNLLGKPAFVENEDQVLHNQRIAKVSLQSHIWDRKFLYYSLLSPTYLSVIKNGATGSTVRHTSPTTILNAWVIEPPKEEQIAIATIISDMDNEIQTLEQRLSKTRQIKQGMMQELLTGKTRLPFDKDTISEVSV